MSAATVHAPPTFTGPAAAAYLVERIIERWLHPTHQQFLRGWADDYERKHAAHLGATAPAHMNWLVHLDSFLQQAPLYGGEVEIGALLQVGAETMPEQPVLDSDLPSPNGMILFARPIEIVDKHLERFGVSGLLWTPAQGRLQGTDKRASGTMTVHFTTNADIIVDAPQSWQAIKDWFPPLSVLHIVFIPHDVLLQPEQDVPEQTASSHLHFIKTLQSFWAFVQQEVVEVEQRELPRPIRKRAERAQRPTSTLHVVKLRRVAASTVERAEGTHHVNWQARWIVRGHWRQQWYAKSQTKRAIWIYPFVKGPADKPLVAKRTVFDVRR